MGSDVQVIILRNPLVYGPEVKANFLSLLKLVDSGLSLPLANIRNERSMIFVDNLAYPLAECVSSPAMRLPSGPFRRSCSRVAPASAAESAPSLSTSRSRREHCTVAGALAN